MKIVLQSAELLWSTPYAELMMERSGRVAWKSEGKIALGSAAPFLRMLIKRGHETVLEHASASFLIVTERGISQAVERHRLASYTQESTQYCNYSLDKFEHEITVIEPPELCAAARESWAWAMDACEAAYFAMLQEGCTPHVARAALPLCLKTEFVMTANFREWRHFIKLRHAKNDHPLMMSLAADILRQLLLVAPTTFEDLNHE